MKGDCFVVRLYWQSPLSMIFRQIERAHSIELVEADDIHLLTD